MAMFCQNKLLTYGKFNILHCDLYKVKKEVKLQVCKRDQMRKQMRWLAVCSAPVDLSDSMTCSAQQHSWASLSVLSIDWPIQPCSLTATSWAWEGNPSSRSSPLNTPPTLEAIRLIHHMITWDIHQNSGNKKCNSWLLFLWFRGKVTWGLRMLFRKHFKTSELSENLKLIKKEKRNKKRAD